jgi:phosphopantetheinyl transferase (holo-ACP synthase)
MQISWRNSLSLSHAVVWREREDPRESRIAERAADTATALLALRELFVEEDFPAEAAGDDIFWKRDWRGRPYVEWQGATAAWAAERGKDCRHLHVSNTHDGNARLVFAVYSEEVVGIGIDAVYLPRLRRPGKDAAYLRRFAAQFMSVAEREAFARSAVHDDEDALRNRVAAHFSLMESASKALGTGLRLGIGMNRASALPPRSLGVTQIAPEVAFLFGTEAEARCAELGAHCCEGYWSLAGDYLVSAALLWRKEQRDVF